MTGDATSNDAIRSRTSRTMGSVSSSTSPKLLTTWTPGARSRMSPCQVPTHPSAWFTQSRLNGLNRRRESSSTKNDRADPGESHRRVSRQSRPRERRVASRLAAGRLVTAARSPVALTPSQVPPASSSRPAQTVGLPAHRKWCSRGSCPRLLPVCRHDQGIVRIHVKEDRYPAHGRSTIQSSGTRTVSRRCEMPS